MADATFEVLATRLPRGACSYGGDYYQIGRETGDLAARVMGGEDMSHMPILYRLPLLTVINRAAASGLRQTWTFPPDVLAHAEEVPR